MKQLLMIPDKNNINESVLLAKKYSLGWEYNDFYMPNILDDDSLKKSIMDLYKMHDVPSLTTIHGAFMDVIPFSKDKKIKDISVLRIEQSIEVTKEIGAKAVIFHTNYNPFLNSKEYVKKWIEKSTKFWSSMLEKHTDIKIYIENMFDETPDIMVELSEVLSKYENYGVCFDYAHATLSKEEPKEWIKKLGKYIKHIHINDNDLVSDQHLPWGSGKVDRQEFYRCYKKYIKDATILIEVSSLESLEKSIEVLNKEGFIDI